MMQLLQTQLTSPADVKRQILASVAAYENSEYLHKASYRYSNLKDELCAIAVAYNIGWYADIEDAEMVFHIIHSKDRSASQTTNSRIVLSYANDNILQSSLSANGNIPETAYTLGQGEGASRVIYIVGDDKEGLQRKEITIDARDIADETLLPDRGYAKLAEYGSGISYECTLSEAFTALYRLAYDVGDKITLQDETLSGGSVDAFITAVTEVYEASGLRLDISLGYDTNTLQGVLSRISDSTKSLIQTDTVSYDTIVTMETSINQMNGYLSTKADKTTTDSLGNAISNNYTEYKQDADGFTRRIGTAEGALNGVRGNLDTLNQFKTKQETLIREDSAGIHVGKIDFKAETLVASDGLHIKDNTGGECAYFTDNKSYIKNANITDTMQIGGVQFVKYSTGSIAVKWVG